jgi:hypothetical protein
LERFARPIAEVSPIAKEPTTSSLTLRASAGNASAAKRPLVRSVSSSSGFRPKAARRCVRSAVDPATISHDHLPAITNRSVALNGSAAARSGVPEGVTRWSTVNSIGPGFTTDHGHSLAVNSRTPRLWRRLAAAGSSSGTSSNSWPAAVAESALSRRSTPSQAWRTKGIHGVRNEPLAGIAIELVSNLHPIAVVLRFGCDHHKSTILSAAVSGRSNGCP